MRRGLNRSIFYFLLTLACVPLRAEFAGVWEGPFDIVNFDAEGTGKLSSSCEKITVDLSQSPKRFRINDTLLECGGKKSSGEKWLDFAIDKNEIFHHGEKVGTMEADQITIVKKIDSRDNETNKKTTARYHGTLSTQFLLLDKTTLGFKVKTYLTYEVDGVAQSLLNQVGQGKLQKK